MTAHPPMSALDSLRTVEFRQTLRGYHIDDVDEYLERVAVEAEALQERLRQQADRMRQATERITALEQEAQQPRAAAAATSTSTEDSLQRTLMLAQKFVDQTHAEAEAEARTIVEDAQQRARSTVSDAETQAKTLVEQAEIRLREDVARLEALRTKLAGDVETISQYLDTERTRLRGFLGEMLRWVDENVQPTANVSAKPPAERPRDDATRPAGGAPSTVGATVSESAGSVGQNSTVNPSNAPGGSGTVPGRPEPAAAPRQGLMSLGGPNNGSPR